MEKRLLFLMLFALNYVCLAQVGINTTTPEGLLHIENGTNKLGLVVPKIDAAENTQGVSTLIPVEATLVYDVDKNCLRVKTANGWSDCLLDSNGVKDEINTSLVGREFWLTSGVSTLDKIYRKPISSGLYYSLFSYSGDSNFLYGGGYSAEYAINTNTTVNPATRRQNIKPNYILSGYLNSYVVGSDGKLYVAGYNVNRQLGVPGTTCSTCNVQSYTEVPMPFSYANEKVVMVASMSTTNTAVLTDLGNVYTAGEGLYGHNGNSSTADQTTFVKVASLSNIKQISGSDQSYPLFGMFTAIDNSGNIFVWGRHYFNYIPGFATTQTVSTPVNVTASFTPFLSPGETIVKISVLYYQTIALTNTGKMIVAGEGYRIGNGAGLTTALTALTPFTLNAGEYIVDLDADSGGAIVATNKRLFCTGLNPLGRFGTADATTKNTWTNVSITALNPAWNIDHIDLADNRTLLAMDSDFSKGGGRILGSGSAANGSLGNQTLNTNIFIIIQF